MNSFGQRLKALRKEAGVSQSFVADHIGVSTQSVSNWECDNTMPDISQIVPLAALLSVSTDYLLGVGTNEYQCAKTRGRRNRRGHHAVCRRRDERHVGSSRQRYADARSFDRRRYRDRRDLSLRDRRCFQGKKKEDLFAPSSGRRDRAADSSPLKTKTAPCKKGRFVLYSYCK